MNTGGEDLASAALAIARVEYPSLDAAPYLDGSGPNGPRGGSADWRRAGCRAPRCDPRLQRVPLRRARVLGNRDRYDDPRNSFLNEVLERRTGIPIALAVVYLEVARRAGVRVAGDQLPGTFPAARSARAAQARGRRVRDHRSVPRRGVAVGGRLPRVAAPARRRRSRLRPEPARADDAAPHRRPHAGEPQAPLRADAIVPAGALHFGSAPRPSIRRPSPSSATAACSPTTCRTSPPPCATSKSTCASRHDPSRPTPKTTTPRRRRRGRHHRALGAREEPPQARRWVQLSPASSFQLPVSSFRLPASGFRFRLPALTCSGLALADNWKLELEARPQSQSAGHAGICAWRGRSASAERPPSSSRISSTCSTRTPCSCATATSTRRRSGGLRRISARGSSVSA